MIAYLKLNITFVVEKREERDMPADTSRSPHYIIYITARDRISLFQKSILYSASFANSASWSAINLP